MIGCEASRFIYALEEVPNSLLEFIDRPGRGFEVFKGHPMFFPIHSSLGVFPVLRTDGVGGRSRMKGSHLQSAFLPYRTYSVPSRVAEGSAQSW